MKEENIVMEYSSHMRSLFHFLQAVIFELVVFACLLPFRFCQVQLKAVGDPNGRPILLIHGYLDNSLMCFYYRWKLKMAGLGPIYTINLGYPFHSMRHYAQKVKDQAEAIARETKKQELALVGHSMGGLVAIYYAAKLAERGTVTDVITVGSPIHGTKTAYLGLGSNANEMRFDSQFLTEVQKGIAETPNTRFYFVAARWDELILPYTSALYGEDPSRQFSLPNLCHMSLLFSKRVADRMIQWLRADSLS